jgi:late competence protein required for DNA uptake (superfamily II DNA/RNA helicase)
MLLVSGLFTLVLGTRVMDIGVLVPVVSIFVLKKETSNYVAINFNHYKYL